MMVWQEKRRVEHARSLATDGVDADGGSVNAIASVDMPR